MNRVSHLIAILLAWLSIADRAAPDVTPDPTLVSESPATVLTINCEGNIGPGGDFSSEGSGGGGGGGGGGDGPSRGFIESIAETVVEDMFGGSERIQTLVSFAKAPLRFIRARAIPGILGVIFGFAFDMAAIIANPFQAIIGSLTNLSSSLTGATQSVTQPIGNLFGSASSAFVSATAPLGALQPFVVTATLLLLAYGALVVSIRLARAIADSIPIVSGIETFLFG
jgi:hypothetical protein